MTCVIYGTSLAGVNVFPAARSHTRRATRLATTTLCLTLAATTMVAAGSTQATAKAAVKTGGGHQLKLSGWTTPAQLRTGATRGLRATGKALVMNGSFKTTRIEKRAWDTARWTSPWVTPGFALTELVPSWQAKTPGRSAVRVLVRGRAADGRKSSWDNVALWAAKDVHVKRHSFKAQPDDLGRMNVDTWQSTSNDGLVSWQVRVDLLRRPGGRAAPRLSAVSGIASRLSTASSVKVSKVGNAAGKTLAVPGYSQMVHRGHYPAWGGGGEAWCSPTSVSMVLAYRRALPGPKAIKWIPATHADPVVDHAARSTYDYRYRGAGNWPFNTAYAATRGRPSVVTRFNSLRELEPYINSGTPVVVSVRFGRGELANAPISMTNGHLMVVVGFDASGNVVVNDPAAPTNATVRRTYDRSQFENVWIPASPSGSGGLAYVIG